MIERPYDLRVTWPSPLPPIDGKYPYFDSLATHPNRLASFSLRDATQVNSLAQSKSKPKDVNYNPTVDTDPRRQDAAKVFIPTGKVSLPNGVQIPIPQFAPESLFATWDAWFGAEFAFEKTAISNYKTFQFTSPKGRIWTEEKCDWDLAALKYPEYVAINQIRYYGGATRGELGANVTIPHPMSPYTIFGIKAETWTRYAMLFNPRPDLPLAIITDAAGATYTGPWWELHQWMSDETREPVKTIDGLLLVPNYKLGATQWGEFWLEFNTSDHGLAELTPARTAYVRNVAMLKGLTPEAAVALLERPK